MFKRKLVKIIPFLLALVLLISTFASCNENGGKPQIRQPGKIDTLVVTTIDAIEKASRSEYYFDVLSGTITQMALVRVDESGAYQPLMAEFETSDSKTWTFTITDGLTCMTARVTAEDVKFTIEYLDLQNNGGYLSRYEDIVVLNDRQIKLVLKTPTRHLSNFTARNHPQTYL